MDQPVTLVLNVAEVPKQSVVQYTEYADGNAVRQVSLYVVRSEPMGAAPGAGLLKHYCIPFRGFDNVEENEP
jgi:hypothetical protein